MSSSPTARKTNPTSRCTAVLRLSVIVAIVSAVFALATPLVQRQLRTHRADAVGRDLQTFKEAFHRYALAQGSWPAATSAPGEVPSGMAAFLENTPWGRETPIGGRYTWDFGSLHRGHYYTAAISIRPVAGYSVTTDREQLLAIDRRIDDGDLSTGRFLLGFHNFPVYVLEP